MHFYPADLVPLITQKWHDSFPSEAEAEASANSLPDKNALESLVSTCYQVSMMREEGREVILRLILINPAAIPDEQGPPEDLLRVIFTSPRPFNEYELRRLSPAIDFERSLIGIEPRPDNGFQIWGLINSGIRWMQQERGGSKKTSQLPPSLVLHVNGPGTLTICKGYRILASISGGKLQDCSSNVFQSKWMRAQFETELALIMNRHENFRSSVLYPVAKVQDNFVLTLQFQILKRIISVTRMSRHGGTFIIFPDSTPDEVLGQDPLVLIKYRFQDDSAIFRHNLLITRTIRLVTTALGDIRDPDRTVSWKDYINLRYESSVYDLEESLYEHAQFLAGLASVDGAVVSTVRGVLGFGAMIVGSFDRLTEIAMANDNEGKIASLSKVESFGSRHRSVYHLCNALHRVMAIIVSQDGNVQLVKWRNGIVTCWDLSTQMFINAE